MRSSAVRISRHAGARAVAMVISGAALLAAAAGCGGGSSPSQMTAEQMFTKALDNLKAASSVRVSGSIVSLGGALTMSLTDSAGGCAGTLSSHGAGSVAVLGIGSKFWIKPDQQYLKSSGVTAATTKALTGKYVSTTNQSASLRTLCGLNGITSQLGTGSNFTKGTTTTISGQQVVQIKAANSPGSAYVTLSANPQIVRVDTSSGILDFSDYGAPLTLTPPPAGQVVDGSKYGF
jgi:hypothetical protein